MMKSLENFTGKSLVQQALSTETPSAWLKRATKGALEKLLSLCLLCFYPETLSLSSAQSSPSGLIRVTVWLLTWTSLLH